MLPGLRMGSMVLYVVKRGELSSTRDMEGDIRPAIVVNHWPGLNRDDGYVNLLVFVDGRNDGMGSGLTWATSRVYSATREPGTWHWPDDPPTPFDQLKELVSKGHPETTEDLKPEVSDAPENLSRGI